MWDYIKEYFFYIFRKKGIEAAQETNNKAKTAIKIHDMWKKIIQEVNKFKNYIHSYLWTCLSMDGKYI